MIEDSSQVFLDDHKMKIPASFDHLSTLLKNQFDIQVNQEALRKNKHLKTVRSYYSNDNKTLYLNPQLSVEQARFAVAKELGYQFLNLTERSFETNLNKEASFEKLLNNFKASYFAAALLLPANGFIDDLKSLALETKWNPKLISSLLSKYQVTAETLLQRMTNLLPKYFGIDNLFFIRLDGRGSMVDYQITKELHLSGLHNPYQNQLREHLCQRWVSISSIKSLQGNDLDHQIDAQISEYWQTDKSYFCISIAQPNRFDNKNGSSVTIGLAMNESLRGAFNFIKDPDLRQKVVHTTCERCSISDCEHRVATPTFVKRQTQQSELEEALKKL